MEEANSRPACPSALGQFDNVVADGALTEIWAVRCKADGCTTHAGRRD